MSFQVTQMNVMANKEGFSLSCEADGGANRGKMLTEEIADQRRAKRRQRYVCEPLYDCCVPTTV